MFTDFLAATFFTPADDVQTHIDVAAAQKKLVAAQLAAGKINAIEWLALSGDVKAAGDYQKNYVDQNSGVGGFFKIPAVLTVVAVVALFAFVWLGGLSWTRGLFAKETK